MSRRSLLSAIAAALVALLPGRRRADGNSVRVFGGWTADGKPWKGWARKVREKPKP